MRKSNFKKLIKEEKEFDKIASTYTENIKPWIRLTGESVEFYAQERLKTIANQLKLQKFFPRTIMDYGCGVGIATPYLFNEFGNQISITGIDVSTESLNIAKSRFSSENSDFHTVNEYLPGQTVDLVFCNGVFHHIPRSKRIDALHFIYASLKIGGFFAFWENNPYNPIMKYNMKHAEIDKNANPIILQDAKNMILNEGFSEIMHGYFFMFPNFLKIFRPLESFFSKIPLGAQYIILLQKQ